MLSPLAGGIAFIVAVFIFPSIPRYQFEKESLSQIEGKDWIRVIQNNKIIFISEPLTWLHPPINSIYIIRPHDLYEGLWTGRGPLGIFYEIFLRYKEESYYVMAMPDCTDHTIERSEPDHGVFPMGEALTMNEQEILIYCLYDWTKEKEALRFEIERVNLEQEN